MDKWLDELRQKLGDWDFKEPFESYFEKNVVMCHPNVTLGRVIESKNPDFPVGMNVVSRAGWVSHFVSDGSDLRKIPPYPKGFPLSLALGMLGMPG